MTMILQVHTQLFGPYPSGVTFVPGLEYQSVGAAFSASAKTWYYNFKQPPIQYAGFNVDWHAQSVHKAVLRMVHFPNGVSTIEDIQEFTPHAPGLVRSDGFEFTPKMRSFRDRALLCELFWQIKGDGVTPITVHNAYVTLFNKVGHYGEV